MDLGWTGLIALGAVLAGAWGHIRWAFGYCSSYLIVHFECHGACGMAVMAYCQHHLAASPFRARVFDGCVEYIRPKKKHGFVARETVGMEGGLYWHGWVPIWVARTNGVSANDDHTSNHKKPLKISTIRPLFNVERFILKALDYAEERVASRPRRHRVHYHTGAGKRVMAERPLRQNNPASSDHWESLEEIESKILRWDRGDLGPRILRAGTKALALDAKAEAFFQEVRRWSGMKDWCLERSIPWKLGALFYGKPGCGKCLGRGTPVLMFDGTIKKVEDIVSGDLLMGPDSRPRTVLSTCSGREELYRVTPRKGAPYVVNRSHILSLKMSGNAGAYKKGQVVNIGIDDYLAETDKFRHYAKGWRSGVEFASVPVPLDPYLLGIWLGDGTQNKPHITTADPEILAEFQRHAALLGLPLRPVTSSHCGKATTYAASHGVVPGRGRRPNPLVTKLQEIGVYDKKHIPHLYLANSRSVRLELLAGLIDTDGHLHAGTYDIVFRSRSLAKGVAYIARSLGMAAYTSTCQKECVNTGQWRTYYRTSISGCIDEIPVRLARKKASARRQRKDVLVTGISVEPIGVGDYFGFEIDGDHLFMLGDFTVTHNTASVRAIGQELDLPIHIFDLASMTNSELREAWQSVTADLPAIALLEDIDGAFIGRTPAEGVELTFDCLLNCMDGVERMDGLLTIVTTNRPETLDDALCNRPGRIDVQLEFGPPDEAGRRHIASRILQDWPEAIEAIVAAGDGESGAQFERRCVAFASTRSGDFSASPTQHERSEAPKIQMYKYNGSGEFLGDSRHGAA